MAQCKLALKRFLRSKRALAVPITFLILLVSTLGIISFTYYYSVQRVNTQSQVLKVSTAKEALLSLDDDALSTLWQPGSSVTLELADSGGLLAVQPSANVLTVDVSGGSEISDSLFNSYVGGVTYELLSGGSNGVGLYLRGDSRSLTNQSGASMSQMYIETGAECAQIQLRYRPSVTYASAGIEDGRVVTNIRIYIANLNQSESIATQGKVPLQISCKTTQLTTQTYQVSSAVDSLTVTSVFDGTVGSVSVPISTTSSGAVIHLETVISNICIERWLR